MTLKLATSEHDLSTEELEIVPYLPSESIPSRGWSIKLKKQEMEVRSAKAEVRTFEETLQARQKELCNGLERSDGGLKPSTKERLS